MAFKRNVYANYLAPDYFPKDLPDLVDQGMTKSIRATLEQFARTGQTIDANRSNFSYADEFDDQVPLDSDRVNDLLDRPDFTGASEMEMMDFIRDNTHEVNLNDLQNKKSVKRDTVETQQVDPENTPGTTA